VVGLNRRTLAHTRNPLRILENWWVSLAPKWTLSGVDSRREWATSL
jgi:hypothetical protein